jgi:biotin-dependent carboxylase-like uncharacterized protein
MAKIIIEKAGLLSTIQDCGRFGYQRFGMPVSGAMDIFSLQTANKLVGNPTGAAVIEATLIGPEISFSQEMTISVCGAGMSPVINGQAVPMYKSISVNRGDLLSFTPLSYGCRAYIAFAGGIDVPLVMGSRSTYIRAKIGGVQGRALIAGDSINIFPSEKREPLSYKIEESDIPDYKSDRPIRIISGPEVKRLGFQGIQSFLTSEFKISEQSDRMGLRLTGPEVKMKNGGHDIISAGISLGTIQLPGNGHPIILMADRLTTGGYARIANVVKEDLTRIAQFRPGDFVKFEEYHLMAGYLE